LAPNPLSPSPTLDPPVTDLDSAAWWEAIGEHRVALQRCGACGRYRFPPGPLCGWCGSEQVSTVDVSGGGTVYSMVVAHVAVSPGYRGELPYTVATVELDEGPRLLGRIAGSAAIGDRVEAVFDDHAEWTELCFMATSELAPTPIARSGAPPETVSAPAVRWNQSTGRRAAIVGVGYSPLTRASGRSVLSQAAEAVSAALADAGLRRNEVDGMGSFMVSDDSVPCVAVSTALGMGPLRSVLDVQLGGQAPCQLVWQAAQAVSRGDAEVVVVYRALNGRSGQRVGAMRFAGVGGQYRYPIGYGAYMMYVGMWGRRFLHETGQGPDDLGAVAVGQRWYAERNGRAVRRQPLDMEAYLAESYVVEPFRRSDCTVEVDGACAVVVTSLERARDLANPPVVVASGCYAAGPHPGLDIGDHLSWDDYTRNYTSWLRDELFGRAGVTPGDVQFAEIYDCFTSTVLMGMEGLGLCPRGGSGAFVRSGGCAIDGALPTNTGGGLLAEGYLHGMNTVAEAVTQIQGRAGVLQVPRHEVAVVTSGALMDGSALVLTGDR
jgi:acetyl-CoA acetyltransferase/uncharacterized OB-fold protein